MCTGVLVIIKVTINRSISHEILHEEKKMLSTSPVHGNLYHIPIMNNLIYRVIKNTLKHIITAFVRHNNDGIYVV